MSDRLNDLKVANYARYDVRPIPTGGNVVNNAFDELQNDIGRLAREVVEWRASDLDVVERVRKGVPDA